MGATPYSASPRSPTCFFESSERRGLGRSWDVIGDAHEVMEAYSLTTLKSLQDAVNAIIEFMGMQVTSSPIAPFSVQPLSAG